MSDAKAYAYLRVSGLTQVDNGGFPRQAEAIAKYANLNGLEIVETFREEGVPGKTELDHRPALCRLLVASKTSGIGIVVIEKMDRLARDLMVSESILADFQRKSITLLSVHEPDLCSSDPTRVLMRHMLAAFAQYERSMIVAKLNAGRQRNRDQGKKAEGRYPYGFDPNRPEEKAVLDYIKSMKLKGISANCVTRALNDHGFKTRKGVNWHPFTVCRIYQRLTV